MSPRGNTTYKKKDGILIVSKDKQAVSWSVNEPKASPSVVMTIPTITNLQQTPETNPKVMLKIFTQEKEQTEAVSHVFLFTSAEARAEANAIKESLTTSIQAYKASVADVSQGGGSSAAMEIANAISGAKAGNVWDDDEKLKSDLSLQQSLMKEDPTLQKTFEEARKFKPESLSNTQFTTQFWASRVHLLRAHAITKHQTRGAYNVFSTLKPTSDGGDKKMSLSKEHVKLIYAQYPLVLRVYDEAVPSKYDEMAFWSKFFQSRLYKKLRGLKIEPNDAVDDVLDQYLDAREFAGTQRPERGFHVARIIDMEGNEENHSQRKGNAPYRELRPQSLDKVPIIRTLNSLSENLISQVAPSDVDPSQPIGMDEATYERLKLQDLSGDAEQNRIILNVRDQSGLFTNSRDPHEVTTSSLPAVDPTLALQTVRSDLAQTFPLPGTNILQPWTSPPFNLNDNDDDADPDEPEPPTGPSPAFTHITSLLTQHLSPTNTQSPLSPTLHDRVLLTHTTANEFLSQFWSAFLSGSPARATSLAALVDSLGRAKERIAAVAEAAEVERQAVLKRLGKEARLVRQGTGVAQRVDEKAVGGGREAVTGLLGPTERAVNTALDRYKRAWEEQAGEGG